MHILSGRKRVYFIYCFCIKPNIRNKADPQKSGLKTGKNVTRDTVGQGKPQLCQPTISS